MLISKEIEMIADWSSIKRYESLGYGKMKQGDVFIILVDHLKPNSTKLVDIKCDYCHIYLKRKYSEYLRNVKIHNKFSCLKCTNVKYKQTCLLKYGVDNISKLESTHNKIKKTNLIRYGSTSYTKLDIFK